MTPDDPGHVLAATDARLRALRANGDPDQSTAVATLLLRRANALVHLGRSAEALVGYDEFLASVVEGTFDVQAVISAFFQQGTLLQVDGRLEESLHAFDAVLERATQDLPALPYVVVEALWGRAVNLQQLGRLAEAIAALGSLVARFAEDTRSIARGYVAQAMISRAWLLEQSGNSAEGLAELEEMIQRFSAADDAEVRRQVADARVRRGRMLSDMGCHEAAGDTYEVVLELAADVEDESLEYAARSALYGKARELAELGHDAQALSTVDALLLRLASGGSSPDGKSLVVIALHLRAHLLIRAGRLADLSGVADALVDCLERPDERGSVDPAFLDAIAEVIAGLIVGHRWTKAIAACDALLVRLESAPEGAARGVAALALADKALALTELGRDEEATVVRQSVLALGDDALAALHERFDNDNSRHDSRPAVDDPFLLYSRAVVLEQLGRTDEAIATFSKLVESFSASDPPLARHIAEAARDRRAQLTSK